MKRERGFSFVELLAALLILAIVAAGAASTWSISSRYPAIKRATDMASLLAVREIERVKAQKFLNISNGTTVTYFDKFGAPTTVTANQVYKATTVLSTAVNRDTTANTEDLVEIVVTIQNAAGTKTYETQRTLLAFGGF